MDRLPIPIGLTGGGGGVTQGRPERLINLYPHKIVDGSRSEVILRGIPGLTLITTLSTSPVQGNGIVFDDSMWWVSGRTVYQVEEDLTVTSRGTVGGTDRVYMSAGWKYDASDLYKLVFVDGVETWWIEKDGAAISSTIGAPGACAAGVVSYPDGASHTVFFDSHHLFVIKNTDQIWSTNDATNGSFCIADDAYASAETYDDNLVGLAVANRYVYAFGEKSTEVFYNAGTSTFPLARHTSGLLEIGCASTGSIAEIDGNVFFLGQSETGDVMPYMAQSFSYTAIGTPEIAEALLESSGLDDSFGFAYRNRGHTFYVLTVPDLNTTYVYDMGTKLWHERQSGTTEWAPQGYVFYKGSHYVGDSSGKIYKIDPDVFTENGTHIRRTLRSGSVGTKNQRVKVPTVELEIAPGTGLTTGQGSDPQVQLRYSRDGGKTWSDALYADMGKIGKYSTKCVWHIGAVGQNFVFEWQMNDPVDTVVLGATALAEAL